MNLFIDEIRKEKIREMKELVRKSNNLSKRIDLKINNMLIEERKKKLH